MAILTIPAVGSDAVVLATGGALPVVVPYDGSGRGTLPTPAFFDLIQINEPEGGMYVWQRSVVDGLGSVIPSARVEVRDATNNTLAEIFADLSGHAPQSNPFLADAEGFARFYAPAGTYKITATSAGLERVWEDVLLGVRFVDMPAELGAYIQQTAQPLIAQMIADALEEFLADNPTATGGYITASGAGSNLPVGWSVEHVSTAHYRLTAPTPPSGFRWAVTANVIANDDRYCNIAEGLTSRIITVQVVDTGSGGVDDDFLFLAQLVPA